MLLVLIVGITRLETVESFPSHDSFSSTSAVANISQEKHLKPLGFVERLHRRSTNDCKTTTDTKITRCSKNINSVNDAGRSWGVAEVNSFQSIKLLKNCNKTVWFKWEVRVNGSSVYMFGLNSTNQTGKYHFVKKGRKSKLILSEPQSQPENNLPIIDERCFEVLSSNEWRHAETGLFVTHNKKKVVEVVLTEDRHLAGKYRLGKPKQPKPNEC